MLSTVAQNGRTYDAEVLALLSPYWMDHFNRFGLFFLDQQRNPPPINFEIPIALKEQEAESMLV